MKKIRIHILIVMGLLMLPFWGQGQTFFGYQTIGVNTFYFSISWQDKPHLGVGYNFRHYGKTFTDIGAELRFPVDEIYKFDNHQIIAGIYTPLRIKRTFGGVGIHARIDKETFESKSNTHYGLAATFLPSYGFNNYTSANVKEGIYYTAGLRATYNPILLTVSKDASGAKSTGYLTGHRVQLGGHMDLHLERTYTLSSDGYATRIFGAKSDFGGEEDDSFQLEGNLYVGATYYLKRW